MSNIQQKREQLMARKLKEMADFGTNQMESTEYHSFDMPDEPEKVASAPEHEELTENVNIKVLPLKFTEYEQVFLQPKTFRNKCGFTIHAETLQLLKYVLADLGSPITMTAYIDNILREHLKKYRDVLVSEGSKRRRRANMAK